MVASKTFKLLAVNQPCSVMHGTYVTLRCIPHVFTYALSTYSLYTASTDYFSSSRLSSIPFDTPTHRTTTVATLMKCTSFAMDNPFHRAEVGPGRKVDIVIMYICISHSDVRILTPFT